MFYFHYLFSNLTYSNDCQISLKVGPGGKNCTSYENCAEKIRSVLLEMVIQTERREDFYLCSDCNFIFQCHCLAMSRVARGSVARQVVALSLAHL